METHSEKIMPACSLPRAVPSRPRQLIPTRRLRCSNNRVPRIPRHGVVIGSERPLKEEADPVWPSSAAGRPCVS